MSSIRKANREVRKLNEILAQELGRTPGGDPRFMWKYSEDWIRTMRVYSEVLGDLKPEYDYKALESGIIAAHPVYRPSKVCQNLHNQWVMAIWIPSESFASWRQTFGDLLEWPKGGEYWPVTHPGGEVCLGPNEVPTFDITMEFIYQSKKDRGLLESELEANYDKRNQQIERRMEDRLMGTIMNEMPSFDGIPGSRSYPIWPISGTKEDPRMSKETKEKLWQP